MDMVLDGGFTNQNHFWQHCVLGPQIVFTFISLAAPRKLRQPEEGSFTFFVVDSLWYVMSLMCRYEFALTNMYFYSLFVCLYCWGLHRSEDKTLLDPPCAWLYFERPGSDNCIKLSSWSEHGIYRRHLSLRVCYFSKQISSPKRKI